MHVIIPLMEDQITLPDITAIDDLVELPSDIRAEIKTVLQVIVDEALHNLTQIWLFGSHARTDFIHDRHINSAGILSHYDSDLDILIVLDKNRINQNGTAWYKLRRSFEDATAIRLRVHPFGVTLKQFIQALSEEHYFYQEIVTQGKLLYVKTGAATAFKRAAALSPAVQHDKAKRYFEDYYDQTLGYQQAFELMFQQQRYRLGSHVLHRVTELIMQTFLLTICDNNPHTHDLTDLLRDISICEPVANKLFPQRSSEDARLMTLLNDAYIHGHYLSPDFVFIVTRQDLIDLGSRVGALQDWVRQFCTAQLMASAPEGVVYDYTPAVAALDMVALQARPLPGEALAKAIEEQADILRLKDKELEQEITAREQAEAREVQALERETVALREKEAALGREEYERKEKEASVQREKRLLAKLKQAGLE